MESEEVKKLKKKRKAEIRKRNIKEPNNDFKAFKPTLDTMKHKVIKGYPLQTKDKHWNRDLFNSNEPK